MTKLSPGDVAPAFALTNPDGDTVALADYAGQTVIVYFYPAAMTPGCTTQAVDFSAAKAAFDEAGFEIIGISPDSAEKLARFREKSELTVTLLADPDKKVIEAYGAWGTKKLYGKEVEGVVRSTFIIDLDDKGAGTIRQAFYNVRASGHVERLAKELGIDD